MRVKLPELVCDEEQQRMAAEGRKPRFECYVSILRGRTKVSQMGGSIIVRYGTAVRPPRACEIDEDEGCVRECIGGISMGVWVAFFFCAGTVSVLCVRRCLRFR